MRICGFLELDKNIKKALKNNLAKVKGKDILNTYLHHPSSFLVIGKNKSVTIWNNFNITNFNKDLFQASYKAFAIGENDIIINTYSQNHCNFRLNLSFWPYRISDMYDITNIVKGREIDNNLVNEIKSLFPK